MNAKPLSSPHPHPLPLSHDPIFPFPQPRRKLGFPTPGAAMDREHDFGGVFELAPEERELKDVCSFIQNEDEDENDDDPVEIDDLPKPFAAFGLYRQRHGDATRGSPASGSRASSASSRRGGTRFSSEAPAKLFSTTGLDDSPFVNKPVIVVDKTAHGHDESLVLKKPAAACPVSEESPLRKKVTENSCECSCPVDIVVNSGGSVHSSDCKLLLKLKKQHSFSSDIDREEAWERKRDLYLMDMEISHRLCGKSRGVARSVSDCGVRAERVDVDVHVDDTSGRMRHRSLTDEDLEELRGCIDLGFGFNYDESCDLKNTFPALELYCAINKQYEDIKSRSSPVSPLDGTHALLRTSSDGSPCSPLSDSWRVASPGDHPSQVKTRLRHWAQAVACSVKQGFSL